MTIIVAYFFTFVSTAAFVALWFWVARKELIIKYNMVECARAQLAASRIQRLKARDSLEIERTQIILDRSMDIYLQSQELYKEALHKPWNYLPGLMMGFRAAGKASE